MNLTGKTSKKDSKKVVTLKIFVSYLIFMLGFNVSRATGPFIISQFPSRPVVDDLLFRLLPYNLYLEYLSDIIILIFIFGGLFLILKEVPRKATAYFGLTGVAYVLRGIINILTPLDKPSGEIINNGLTKLLQGTWIYDRIYYQMGMFTSGHMMLATLIYLFMLEIYPTNSKLKLAMQILLFTEGILLIWSRGHYSIDVLGGWALAVLSYRYLRTYFEKLEIY